MRLTHRRSIHLLANQRTHIVRMQHLSPIQNSNRRYERP
jgi:hypothetical protein